MNPLPRPSAEGRPRVLVLTTTYPRWAADSTPSFVATLTEECVRAGMDATVLAPHHAGAKMSEEIEGVHIRRFRYWFTASGERLCYDGGIASNLRRSVRSLIQLPLLMISATWRLLQESRRIRPHILHAHWLMPGGLAATVVGRLRGIPVVVSLHGSDAQMARHLPKAVRSAMARNVSAFTANSPWTLSLWNSAVPEGTAVSHATHLVPMGFQRPALPSLRPRSPGPPTILGVGRLSSEKGFDTILKAAGVLGARALPVRVVLVGDGPLRPELEREGTALTKAGLLEFTGPLNLAEVYARYAEADILVVSSLREGQGLTILEALASGLPVVTTRVGVAEAVVVDGANGVLISDRSPETLADAIQAALAPQALARLREGARKTDLRRFEWPNVAAEFVKIYADVRSR